MRSLRTTNSPSHSRQTIASGAMQCQCDADIVEGMRDFSAAKGAVPAARRDYNGMVDVR